ncbi:LysR family transcriptional regulator ArgP [uncultured Roseobacter sp.]|uniref:LysR family transcriptional regulator ArgP n=1 Tax=uncultured Roseobacter sp. TaxID=114847 RepID=UPI00261E57A5|nr:LysR family transcriptional regulator ArgP [uncultured Roseobacter sp.]
MRYDPAQLTALTAIVRHGSFDLAAARLGVTPSAVSQRIRALEEQAGTALVVRSQPCEATRAGMVLVRHAENVALLEAQVTAHLGASGNDTEQPVIRLAVNADSLATWLVPALSKVPDVIWDLVIDDQDHAADWLRRGEVSAAVSGNPGPVPGCDSTKLGSMRYVATASPAYMTRWFPDGLTREALRVAPLMAFNAKDRLQHRWITHATGERLSPPTHRIASTHAFVDAALAGIGWGMNPEPLVRSHLQSGNLLPLAPDMPLDVPLYWQASRQMAPALKPLNRAIRDATATRLQQIIT